MGKTLVTKLAFDWAILGQTLPCGQVQLHCLKDFFYCQLLFGWLKKTFSREGLAGHKKKDELTHSFRNHYQKSPLDDRYKLSSGAHKWWLMYLTDGKKTTYWG